MTNEGMRRDAVTMDAVMHDMLGLDPAVLATMRTPAANEEGAGTPGASSQAGLHSFMRRVLALRLSLQDAEVAAVRLKTESSAKANGWPDARTANVAMLLVWALVSPDRQLQGLPEVPLLLAGPGDRAADLLDPTPDPSIATADLVDRMSRVMAITDEITERHRRGIARPSFDERPVPSGNELIRTLLGLGHRLISPQPDT